MSTVSNENKQANKQISKQTNKQTFKETSAMCKISVNCHNWNLPLRLIHSISSFGGMNPVSISKQQKLHEKKKKKSLSMSIKHDQHLQA